MNRRWLAIGGMGATLVAPFLILHWAPESEFSQSLCPHKLLTGFPCPGCGITRSIMALYRGDLSGSFAYHAFGLPLVLACVVGIVLLAIESRSERRFSRALLFDMRVAKGAAFLLVSYHIVRLWQFATTHDVDGILSESIWR